MTWDTVIGLETHIELSTKSKIFCGCTTEFGGEPNTHCCPVCIGLPGSLPRLNKKAVEYGIKAGIVTNCKIAKKIKMDRKNYVYPDLSKAYQISQFDRPVCSEGYIMLSSGKKIRINRIHIEEDAGKLIHEKGKILIDYNRAGVPLIEIVTEPDFSSADEVKEYLERLRLLMRYADVSDCKMQEGSMRCDVNISVKPEGSEKFGTRTEIKNMNSISFMVKAIEYESERQKEVLSSGGRIVQETRRFDESSGETESMRDKEDSHDYRYFKEPDLPFVDLSLIEEDVRDSFKIELPDEKMKKYTGAYGLGVKDAEMIVRYARLTKYYEAMAEQSGNPKLSANILISHIFRHMEDEEAKENADIPVSAEAVAEVVRYISEGEISNNFTKKIIDTMITEGKGFSELYKLSDFKAVDNSALSGIIDETVKENGKTVQDFLAGKDKAIFALVGQVMKKTGGKADAASVRQMLEESIKKLYK